jgi:hypothetical protein
MVGCVPSKTENNVHGVQAGCITHTISSKSSNDTLDNDVEIDDKDADIRQNFLLNRRLGLAVMDDDDDNDDDDDDDGNILDSYDIFMAPCGN